MPTHHCRLFYWRKENKMASYSSIIAAIDDAILNWADRPASISINGRQTTYRSLDDLIRARKYYAQLAANSNSGRKFRITEIKANGAR